MAQWFRILIHDGPEDWIATAKQKSLLAGGMSIRNFGKDNDWSIRQYERDTPEVLTALMAMAEENRALTILKEVEQVLMDYDDTGLHPADKIRNMLKELPQPDCQDDCEHAREGTVPICRSVPVCKCGADLNGPGQQVCICYEKP